jgi:mannose-1-phosphate guanylyltransferase / phosphomannomutase
MSDINQPTHMPARGGSAFGGKAVILAGGKGTRLGSLTVSLPKPLVEIGGQPVLDYQIRLLQNHGIRDIVVLTGYLGEKIAVFVGDGSRWGIKAQCVQEETPQGTAGALRALRHIARDDFLVMSGDIMVAMDISSFITWHNARPRSLGTIVIRQTSTPHHSDLVAVDDVGRITALFARPHNADTALGNNLGVASLYIFSPEFLRFIPPVGKHDIERDIFPRVLADGGALYGYRSDEYVCDMGTPDRLMRVRADCEKGILQMP